MSTVQNDWRKGMSKEKHIEEMAEVIRGSDILCHTCGESTYAYCADAIAELLYNAGYRKQKESEWEISCDGYYPYCKNCGYEPPWVNGEDMRTTFCPDCGFKMKGGAEDEAR